MQGGQCLGFGDHFFLTQTVAGRGESRGIARENADFAEESVGIFILAMELLSLASHGGAELE
jgi:hypothetical protein